jgi:hypothetical protein
MRKSLPENEPSDLVIGWTTVTQTHDPQFWIRNPKKPKPGAQQASDLVLIPPRAIANHTAIIAQSGVGKSFFLGRYIEEVVLKTRARCVVLDPNGDFRKVANVEKAALWKDAAYDAESGTGKLPHEPNRQTFLSRWTEIRTRVRGGPSMIDPKAQRYQLWWEWLDMSLLAEELPEMSRTQLFQMHRFVRALSRVLGYKLAITGKSTDLLAAARAISKKARSSTNELEKHLDAHYSPSIVFGPQIDRGARRVSRQDGKGSYPRVTLEILLANLRKSAATLREDVTLTVERFYFNKERDYETAGIIRKEPNKDTTVPRRYRVDVLDLPTFPDIQTRLLAVYSQTAALLENARERWNRAMEHPASEDIRVPTLIVVDEAHNLIPKEPRTQAYAALRELFRTIAAEGRKYGLFLVLVSQRPDKLDPLVLSECQNRALMRLGSRAVLEATRAMLGLEDLPPKTLESCLDLGKSRVLLVGPWSGGEPTFFYTAARRTTEGGRDLRPEHWASSRFAPAPPSSTIPPTKSPVPATLPSKLLPTLPTK